MTRLNIRPLVADDIHFAITQMKNEGWVPLRGCFEAILENNPKGCFLAQSDSGPIGMVTTAGFKSTAWVGNLIVKQEFRKHGIGGALMKKAIDHLEAKGFETIRLEADPPGINIYRRLGFEAEFESLRFRLNGKQGDFVAQSDRLTETDLGEVLQFDVSWFGDNREDLLRSIHRRVRRAYADRENSALTGYLFTSETDDGLFFGPFVAQGSDTAKRLIEMALADRESAAATIGLPAPNLDGVKLLEGLGFERMAPSVRMVRGKKANGGEPRGIFGIAGGAVG